MMAQRGQRPRGGRGNGRGRGAGALGRVRGRQAQLALPAAGHDSGEEGSGSRGLRAETTLPGLGSGFRGLRTETTLPGFEQQRAELACDKQWKSGG